MPSIRRQKRNDEPKENDVYHFYAAWSFSAAEKFPLDSRNNDKSDKAHCLRAVIYACVRYSQLQMENFLYRMMFDKIENVCQS